MTSETTFQLHLEVNNNYITAVDLLASNCKLSKQRIKQAMKNGSVWLTHNKRTFRLRRAKKTLSSGDQVHLYYNESIQKMQAAEPILLEDNRVYSIWHKPRGIFSQGSKWGDHCSIARWIEINHLPQRQAFTIHRLDRATSGIMLIAHSKNTAAFMAKQFEERRVQKHYLAITASPLVKTEFSINNDLDGKKAISHFQLIDHQPPYSLFDINIETGRKHQIRRHLAETDMPVLGDRMYSNQKIITGNHPDLQLTAYKLSFLCPLSQKTKTVELPLKYQISINDLGVF